ncbi:MAG: hypothetical protein JWQ87_5482 [Candidatus Sulfotelmatobacter sp.]|nr:hypothetical protein [Candidatus Sulfotelmatobacter sp.]
MKKALTYFWQHGCITLLCCAIAALPIVGCTNAQRLQVVTDIKTFLPAVTNVAEAVCAFTPAAPICIGGVAAVSGSANALDTWLVNYFTAKQNGTVPPGTIASLNAAITQFEADATNILDAVRILDPSKQAEIQALAAAASILLAAAETLFPSTVVQPTSLKFAHLAPATKFDLGKWTSDYNAKVDAAQKKLPRNVNLKKVHLHGTLARFATAGVAK